MALRPRGLPAVLAALLVVAGCQPDQPGGNATLPEGTYACASTYYATGTQRLGATATGVAIEVAGSRYAITDATGGEYRYDAATGQVTWAGGSLGGTPTTYEHNSSGHVLVLRLADGDGTQGQWLCTNGDGGTNPVTDRGDQGDRGSPAAVVPLGDVAALPDGWSLQVLEVVRDATAEVLAHNEYNTPPADDRQFLMVTVAFDRGSSTQETFTAGNVVLVTADGRSYAAHEARCGDYPDAVDTRRLDPAQAATGNICWSVARSDADTVHLEYRNGLVGGPPVALALS